MFHSKREFGIVEKEILIYDFPERIKDRHRLRCHLWVDHKPAGLGGNKGRLRLVERVVGIKVHFLLGEKLNHVIPVVVENRDGAAWHPAPRISVLVFHWLAIAFSWLVS